MAAVTATRLPRVGGKQVFLPNFTLTLVRTPEQPPNFASFIVPLNLNKLDLRDYLLHAYGVRIKGVRSYIQQQKIRADKPMAIRPLQRQWYRPRSVKRMIVELERPFEWAEVPDDFGPWDQKAFEIVAKEHKAQQKLHKEGTNEKPAWKERASIAEQAQALLTGDDKWESSRPAWENVGEAREVETDVDLSKQ